jgi:hypothetical protein
MLTFHHPIEGAEKGAAVVLITFVVLYTLCATVLLLAVAQDRRRAAGSHGRRAEPSSPRRNRGSQHELVFTTQH